MQVNGEPIRAGEVILCGGAINSPQLLQLSGIGDAAELEALDISVVDHRPGVGMNLQDHLEVYVQCASKLPVTVAPAYKWRNRPLVGLKWLLFKSGPGATHHFEAGGFIRSKSFCNWTKPIRKLRLKFARSIRWLITRPMKNTMANGAASKSKSSNRGLPLTLAPVIARR